MLEAVCWCSEVVSKDGVDIVVKAELRLIITLLLFKLSTEETIFESSEHVSEGLQLFV